MKRTDTRGSRILAIWALTIGWVSALNAIELRREPDPQPDTGAIRLGPGANVSFASLEEGKEILMARDAFVERLSPFDRSARLKVERAVDEGEYLEFVGANVLEWQAEEMYRITSLVEGIREPLAAFDLPWPSRIWMIKTTGREEGHAAYTRGAAIVLPDSDLSTSDERLRRKICHELFHILSRSNPGLRDRLYRLIGFEKCDELAFPDSLAGRRITNPDAPWNDHCIRVEVEGSARWAIPVLYSRTETYDEERGGEFFDYLEFQLLLVERADAGSGVEPLRRHNDPWLVSVQDVSGFFEQVGRNTGYIIHPEEILADNFTSVILGQEDAPTPELIESIEMVLRDP